MPAKTLLERAGKCYGQCASELTRKSPNPAQLTSSESEQRIAFGIASDWTRRAAALKPLEYERRLMNRSKRAPGVSELVRFNLAWSGMNAIFSRNSALSLLGVGFGSSEFDRFKFVYKHCGMAQADARKHVEALHAVLNTKISSTLPGQPIQALNTTLKVLHVKYTPDHVQSVGTGKKISAAIQSGSLAHLDLPVIIYAMRNWSVHGGLIDSSFRSENRFRNFIDTILLALSEIHDGCSRALLAKV